MEKPTSIALISAGFPPHMFGGIDMQTYDLAHAISSEKVSVAVFCGGSKVPTAIHENDYLTIFRLPMAEILPRVVWFQLQNMGFLKSKLSEFEIVHTQHSSGSIYGFLKKKIGKPWVISFHDHQFRRFMVTFEVKPWNLTPKDLAYYIGGYPLFELLTKIELKLGDHFIACGKTGYWDYVRFSRMNPLKTTIIPNGINIEKINAILQSYHAKANLNSKNEFVIFTCGRLYASKGLHYLIKAMPHVLRKFKNVKLKIFGKGPMYYRLQNLIRALGLKEKVSLQGHVPYERLIYEMSRSDLAVFPSMIEVGPSLAVMEAMVCGKAVVAFKYPFSMELIEHLKTGYLVPPKDTEKLGEAICILLKDEKLRKNLGRNAYLKISTKHDIKKIVRRYLEVYSKLLSESD